MFGKITNGSTFQMFYLKKCQENNFQFFKKTNQLNLLEQSPSLQQHQFKNEMNLTLIKNLELKFTRFRKFKLLRDISL